MLASIHQEEIAMSTVAFSIPEDVRAMREGLHAFVKAEVLDLPRKKNKEMFEDQPQLYREDGCFSEKLLLLIGEVRRTDSEAGNVW